MVETNLGQRWAALASVEEPQRGAEMRRTLDEVLATGEGERSDALEQMVAAEYALPDSELRPFTVSRLRTWIAIWHDDPARANSLARGYDAAFDKLGAALAMRRSSLVQTVARHDLTPEEVETLFELIPSIVRQVPKTAARTRYYEKPERKKPFWKFW